MTTIQYPNYLDVAFPLLQPLIDCKVRAYTPLFGELSMHVAEYATSDKVDTQRAIIFFQDNIPREYIALYQMTVPELSGCLDDNLYTTRLPDGALPMKNSPERKLMALAYMYFAYRNFQFRIGLRQEDQEKVSTNMEYFDFLGRIEGITIAQRTDDALKKIKCHGYVFHQYEWYGSSIANNTLLADTETTISYLKFKGFTVTNKVAPGQIVVYHSDKTVRHYGRVESVRGKEITVKSNGALNTSISIVLLLWNMFTEIESPS